MSCKIGNDRSSNIIKDTIHPVVGDFADGFGELFAPEFRNCMEILLFEPFDLDFFAILGKDDDIDGESHIIRGDPCGVEGEEAGFERKTDARIIIDRPL